LPSFGIDTIIIFKELLANKGDTATFSDSEPLVSSARIDSLEVIQIAVFLESEFGVDFSHRPFDKFDFKPLDAMMEMLEDLMPS